MRCWIFACVTSETNERRNGKEKKSLKLRVVCVHLHLRWCVKPKKLLCGSEQSPSQNPKVTRKSVLEACQCWGCPKAVCFTFKQRMTHMLSELWENITSCTPICKFSTQENNRNLFICLSREILLRISLVFAICLTKSVYHHLESYCDI